MATVVYDGYCNLCNGTVGFLYRNARPGTLDFVSNPEPDQTTVVVIDGEITHYFEWVGAVVYRSRDLRTHSTMYQTDPVLQCLFIGFNRDHLFIRYDLHERHWSPSTPPLSIAVVLAGPRARHVLKIGPLAAGETLAAHWDDGPLPEGMQVAARRIVEIGIPFDAVDCRVAESIFVQTQLQHEGRIYQQYAGISMVRPSVDFEASQWSV